MPTDSVVPAGHARLTLDLELDAEPVAGALSGAAGGTEEFVGWAGLTRAIELALEAARAAGGRPEDGR